MNKINRLFKTFTICIILLLSSCTNSSNHNDENGYEDGTYCADITYYNPNTGTNSTYTLEVEIENNELVKIYWNNGGWLDEDHFNSETIDESGYCEFTSDKEYDYTVQISGQDCGYTDQNKFSSDIQADEKSLICSKCGHEKESYDNYCYDCQDDIDHTCKRCGQIDIFMFSTDDYCSDCKDQLENTCSRCGRHQYNVNGGLCDECEEENY